MLPKILLIGHGACRTSLLILIRVNFSRAEILETGSLREGISRIQHDSLDLVLVDIDQSGPRALEMLRAVSASRPTIRFAVMSVMDSRESISASLSGGMHGFVSTRQPDEEVLAAIKEILSGGVYVPWSSVKGRGGGAKSDEALNLTPRQHQVLRLLSLGMSNKEIARALRIAESTTKIHTAMLMRALGVRNRTEAAFKAGKWLSVTQQMPDHLGEDGKADSAF